MVSPTFFVEGENDTATDEWVADLDEFGEEEQERAEEASACNGTDDGWGDGFHKMMANWRINLDLWKRHKHLPEKTWRMPLLR